jgi:hypothetical protein
VSILPKIIVNTPAINRSGTTARQILFQFNFNSYDAITASGTVTLRVATKEDFSDATTVTPTTFFTRGIGTTTWSSSIAGNTLTTTHQTNEVKIDLSALAAETKQYVKVLFTVGGVTFESTPILYTNLTEIDFKLQNPINTGAVRPQKVRVMDRIIATVASAFTIKVEVSNNALDTTPTWENATTAYLAGDYYTFTNNTKTNANWAISVKYYIKKNNAADSIEIRELFVAFV